MALSPALLYSETEVCTHTYITTIGLRLFVFVFPYINNTNIATLWTSEMKAKFVALNKVTEMCHHILVNYRANSFADTTAWIYV
jgi:hypothetical protein